MKYNINNIINLRGHREQAFRFAAGKFKGGAKGCHTKGCEIFTPLALSVRGVEISKEISYLQAFGGETMFSEFPSFA